MYQPEAADGLALDRAERIRGELHVVVFVGLRDGARLVHLDEVHRKRMDEHETINGVPVTEEQIEAWAAEAEAGYDAKALKKRGRGRPGRAAEPTRVVAIRLTADELAAIDERAAREQKSRSEVVREALAAF